MALITVAPGLRVSKKAEESLAAQHEVVRSFDKVVGEMGLLDRGSLTIGNGVLSYLSDRDFRGNNAAISPTYLILFPTYITDTTWQKFVILRHRGTDVWLREYPYADGNTLGQIRRANLATVADVPGMQEKKFARNVEQFTVETVGTSRVVLRIRAVTRQAKRPEACDITFQVVMRGGT